MSISNKPVFIALAGTASAGKDILGHALAEYEGLLHISGSDIARDLKKRAFGDTKEALLVRGDPYINILRRGSPGVIVDEVYATWLQNRAQYPKGFVVSGVRAIGEVELIKSIGGIVIFVDADPKVRYERSLARARDAGDTVSFEAFLASEQREMSDDRDNKSVQNLSAMKEMADIVLDNSAQNISEFCEYSVAVLRRYLAQ